MSNKLSCVLVPPPTTLQLMSNLKCKDFKACFPVLSCRSFWFNTTLAKAFLALLSQQAWLGTEAWEQRTWSVALKTSLLAVKQLFLFWANKLKTPYQFSPSLFIFFSCYLICHKWNWSARVVYWTIYHWYLHPSFFALRPACVGPHLR